jgi:hypothetical protein
MKPRKAARPKKCCVEGCSNAATLIVMLEDDYGIFTPNPFHFCARDKSLPFICTECAKRNEAEATDSGRYRKYPFSKWGSKRGITTGWTTYRDIVTKQRVEI